MRKNTIYIIAGPTAVGKSACAIELAKRIDGEIVNCDSVQLYKYVDIGSAKPSAEDMKKVPHHLFSIVEPDYVMTAATYQKLAFAVINNILARGKTPILVGGTGLYMNSIIYDMDFAGKDENRTRRLELEKMAEEKGAEYMHNYLSGLDPASAERIHPNNVRKVIRAIEAFEQGDAIKSLKECPLNPNYNFELYALTMDREVLYERINWRVISLLKKGLIEEVKGLLDKGYNINLSSMKGIGYKELYSFIKGEEPFNVAAKNIMKNTRHYAKKQITWLKRYDFARWINVKPDDTPAMIADKIINYDRNHESETEVTGE